MNIEDIKFEDFLGFFPELELPVTLTEDSAKEFSLHNKALPGIMVFKYLVQNDDEWDELTEIVPCFKVPSTQEFGIHAIIYWKASLLNYEYIMQTFDLDGNFIDGKVISGLVSNGESIIRTVSTLDKDWTLHLVVGEENPNAKEINKESKAFTMELLASGEIIFSLNEDQI